MSTITELRQQIDRGGLDGTFASVYCADAAGVAVQKVRYLKAIDRFESLFSQKDGLFLFKKNKIGPLLR